MHEIPLLANITLALVVAFAGGLIARRLGLPTIVGYLLAGIAIGPFTPGVVGDTATIQELAEVGVIFLLFGVGLHFSLGDLWRVRQIAVPGALLQTVFAALLGFGLTRLFGWSVPAGIILGLAISVASTVVLLRGLMDHSLLETRHGRIAVGWLVMEDIFSVLILVVMPALSPDTGASDWIGLVATLLKAVLFMAIMFLAGGRVLPWLLERIAHTRSRELFILAVLAITLGTAMAAAQLFGISLALGAFMAGAVISQSRLSHQVGADVLPFREAFSTLFFVSVGMLVNPAFLWERLGPVVALTSLVVLGKALITILMGLLFPKSMRTFLVVAIGLSQIGEFSFILGEAGLALRLLAADQYALILAASLISITINPFLYRLLPGLEAALRRIPVFARRFDDPPSPPEVDSESLRNHVVVVGYGRVGKLLVDVLESLQIPILAVEQETDRVAALAQRRIPVLCGDAGNSDVLMHARLDRARVLVTTLPDDTSAALVVAAAKDIHPELPVIARAATEDGERALEKLGARRTIRAEFEGGLELVHQTLLCLGFPLREAHEYTNALRRERDGRSTAEGDYSTLQNLLLAVEGTEIHWIPLGQANPLDGQTLESANIRARTGASVVAIIRNRTLMANPKSVTAFAAGDWIGIIGDKEQVETARQHLNPGSTMPEPESADTLPPQR